MPVPTLVGQGLSLPSRLAEPGVVAEQGVGDRPLGNRWAAAAIGFVPDPGIAGTRRGNRRIEGRSSPTLEWSQHGPRGVLRQDAWDELRLPARSPPRIPGVLGRSTISAVGSGGSSWSIMRTAHSRILARAASRKILVQLVGRAAAASSLSSGGLPAPSPRRGSRTIRARSRRAAEVVVVPADSQDRARAPPRAGSVADYDQASGDGDLYGGPPLIGRVGRRSPPVARLSNCAIQAARPPVRPPGAGRNQNAASSSLWSLGSAVAGGPASAQRLRANDLGVVTQPGLEAVDPE